MEASFVKNHMITCVSTREYYVSKVLPRLRTGQPRCLTTLLFLRRLSRSDYLDGAILGFVYHLRLEVHRNACWLQDLSGCLRSLFTTSPPMRKYPLLQYRSRDVSRIVVIKLLGLRITSSRPEATASLRARIFSPRQRDRKGANRECLIRGRRCYLPL